ncbi:MAG TPA: MFS transporter [Bryobacteraceae bacterium]|nr:MFS transporter [Bryobacteraceae bacterium]
MAGVRALLQRNRNYRWLWTGQLVTEIGDHFNNIAVFSLAYAMTQNGIVVSGVMIARAAPVLLAGPVAGVLLDRMDRRRIMIASDLIRAVLALGFMLAVSRHSTPLLYLLSALLMFASPFFTSGRASILPRITSPEELHAANSVTQTTQWITTTLGAFFGGISVAWLGYHWAFVLNSLSFVFSAWCVSRLRPPRGGFRAHREAMNESNVVRPWHEYREGLAYMLSVPLLTAIATVHTGWATGGGAAQVLFTLFGEQVFGRGPRGIGEVWGCAGLGLIAGGMVGHRIGPKLTFLAYRWTIGIVYVIHGAAYVMFSQMQNYALALFFIGLSRAAVAVSSVLNYTQVVRHVPDHFRGRVFATLETLTWAVMMLSLAGAGVASEHHSPRVIGAWSGVLSSTTALFWAWANIARRMPEPPDFRHAEDVEVHGEVTR